jgi:putative transposase
VVNVSCAIATGVNASGQREILGVDVFTSEDGASWTSFLRGLAQVVAFRDDPCPPRP